MLLPPLFAALARLVFAQVVVLAPQSGQSAGVLSTASSSVPTEMFAIKVKTMEQSDDPCNHDNP